MTKSRVILSEQGPRSPLARALGGAGKKEHSLVLYAVAIPLPFVNQWLSHAIYIAVAAIWLVPDKRIESHLRAEHAGRT
jgi:uncharacterized membrane protein